MTLIDYDTGAIVLDPLAARQANERRIGEFLLSYSNPRTRYAYRHILKEFLAFTEELDVIDLMTDVKRGHVDAYMRSCESRGQSATTIYRKVSTVSTFFTFCVGEDYCLRNPAVNVRRPVLPRESTRAWMTRRELADFMTVATEAGGYPYALACLLAFNGLRVSEATGANIEDLGREKYHDTLRIVGKGNQPDLIALPARTMDALEKAHDGRKAGPLLLNRAGTRMQRDAANRIMKRLALRAGIAKPITCHSARHSAVTALLEAGADITAAQSFARHADSRTTSTYDRRRRKLDSAGSYVIANYIAEVER